MDDEKKEIIEEFILTEQNYIKELVSMKLHYEKLLVSLEPIFKDLFVNLEKIIETHEPFLREIQKFFNKRSSKTLIDVFLILQRSQKIYQSYSSKYKKYHMLYSCLSTDKENGENVNVSKKLA